MALEMNCYIGADGVAAFLGYFLLLLTRSNPGCGVGNPAIIDIPYFKEWREAKNIILSSCIALLKLINRKK